MLKFMRSPIFRFNEQLLETLDHEGGCNEHPYKRIYVNTEYDGMVLHNSGREKQVTVSLTNDLVKVTYGSNTGGKTDIVVKDYLRMDMKAMAIQVIEFFEGVWIPGTET